MINFKQYTLLICIHIFFVPQFSNAMELIIPEEKPNDTKQEKPQEIKQPLSLKQCCFDGLLKEENKEKVALQLQKTVLPTELMQEFTSEVGQKGSVAYITHIAPALPQTVYPDIGLELLCSRVDDKAQRKNSIEALLKHTNDNEPITSILHGIHACLDTIQGESSTKKELFMMGASHPFVHATFLNFLFSKGIAPDENALEIYLNALEIERPKIMIKFLNNIKTNQDFFDDILQKEFFKKRFMHLSSDDIQRSFALRNSYNGAYKNVEKLLQVGLRPNPTGINFCVIDYNSYFVDKETVFKHFLNKLTALRGERQLNLEYLTMALDDFFGLEIDEDTFAIIDTIRNFYRDKPEHTNISYLKTELKDHPFAQKMPLFEQMIVETTEFYHDILRLLMPYCKNELQQHKEDLEEEFQMSLEELEKLCDDQKK